MYAVIRSVGMIVLAVLAVRDIRCRRIPVWALAVLSMAVLLCRMLLKDITVAESIAGGAVGIGFILISRITGEAFGYADSILIMLLGLFLGVWELFAVLMIAFGLAAIYAAGGLVAGRFSRKITFPFIPFLTIAYAGVVLSAAK